jgi:hypothetical protein
VESCARAISRSLLAVLALLRDLVDALFDRISIVENRIAGTRMTAGSTNDDGRNETLGSED